MSIAIWEASGVWVSLLRALWLVFACHDRAGILLTARNAHFKSMSYIIQVCCPLLVQAWQSIRSLFPDEKPNVSTSSKWKETVLLRNDTAGLSLSSACLGPPLAPAPPPLRAPPYQTNKKNLQQKPKPKQKTKTAVREVVNV